MLNQVVLVGRIFDIEDKILTVKIPKQKENGIDIIATRLDETMNKSVQENCKKDDIVGIKGRVETDEEGIYIKVEKVTFLSSK